MKLLLWIRSLVSTLLLFPVVTFVLCLLVFFSVFVLRSDRVANQVIRAWGRSACFLYGVRVHVSGAENLPPGGAIVLFNHVSFFDIFSIYSKFPEMRFGAKIELFSIPVLGAAMKALGTLPIERSNRQAAIRTLEEAQERARRGEKFLLSPEGGRNTEEKLLPFKAGPFVFAIQAGIPLVPIVIRGALDVWPKGVAIPATSKWNYDISLTVLKPISTEGRTVAQRSELQAIVREEMERELSRPAQFSRSTFQSVTSP
jgi:1-acyl-sn-glycerol-3-phosphate acyltransferase